MSFQTYPPYGGPGLAPQPNFSSRPSHSPQPYQQYPPPRSSHSPYPPPQQPYGAPPQQQPYPPQPPYGYPQQPYGTPSGGAPAPYQQSPYPSQQPNAYPQPYGAPGGGMPALYQQPYPPQQPNAYPQPPAPYGAPMNYGQPTPPSPGYELLPQLPSIPYNADLDARALRKAMKGFGTDEKTLIDVLHNKGPLQIEILRETFFNMFKRRLLADVESETSSWFREGLAAIIRGPLLQDCHLLYNAMDGLGTKESLLNEVLLGRSNADIRAIKTTYEKRYRRRLIDDIKGDLSADTERHFLMVLEANRNEDSAPVIPQDVDRDVATLWGATEAIRGKDRLTVCEIFTKRSDNQLRAIAHTYQQKHGKPLEWVIKKEFRGHMEDALLYQLRTAMDKAMRDANLLEASMKGFGTKDHLLIARVVKIHWDPRHMGQVKGAYQHAFGRSLSSRISSDTSGDYERLMVKCVEFSDYVQPGISWF
ncbi:hypothetical protein ACMFMF_003555 [Clarireedia jacksonii]